MSAFWCDYKHANSKSLCRFGSGGLFCDSLAVEDSGEAVDHGSEDGFFRDATIDERLLMPLYTRGSC